MSWRMSRRESRRRSQHSWRHSQRRERQRQCLELGRNWRQVFSILAPGLLLSSSLLISHPISLKISLTFLQIFSLPLPKLPRCSPLPRQLLSKLSLVPARLERIDVLGSGGGARSPPEVVCCRASVNR